MGRTAQQREKGIVTIDLDLMEHDGVRYHLEDWQRPYIKMLLESKIV
jgi:2-amino-4-hydroxy-6-hydroxymethyldihydropteridine diphosphokinase